MKQKSKLTQWTVTILLFAWGMISFIVIAGEESQTEPVSLGTFLFVKAIAMLSLLLCIWVGKQLYKKGFIPEMKEEDEEC